MGGTCPVTGKRCFKSKAQARRGMKNLAERLTIYLCAECRFFHLTGTEKAGRFRNGKK